MFKSLGTPFSAELLSASSTDQELPQHHNEGKYLLLELMNLVEFPRAATADTDDIRRCVSDSNETTDLEPRSERISKLIEKPLTGLENEIRRILRLKHTEPRPVKA
ncbi:MAG: hypothetical protein ACU84Q_00285 [Gammaproteobacteria bacterium]